jgi:hypothetical protein
MLWPDIKAHSGPELFVTAQTPWPALNITGPGLIVTNRLMAKSLRMMVAVSALLLSILHHNLILLESAF